MARNTPEQAERRRAWSQAARPSSRAASDARACPGPTPGRRPPQNPPRRRRGEPPPPRGPPRAGGGGRGGGGGGGGGGAGGGGGGARRVLRGAKGPAGRPGVRPA